MELRRYSYSRFGASGVIVLVIALAAIALLLRMEPKIKGILDRNYRSLAAVERILIALVRINAQIGAAEEQEALRAGVRKLKANITEPGERELVAEIETVLSGGSVLEYGRLAELLEQMAEINRKPLEESAVEVGRLSRAGAWGVMFLGLFGFGSALLGMQQFKLRLLDPAAEIHAALTAFQSGDPHRRVNLLGSAHGQFLSIGRGVNKLLDSVGQRAEPVVSGEAAQNKALARYALDLDPEPLVVLDDRGGILLTNRAALSLLTGNSSLELRQILKDASSGAGLDAVKEYVQIPGTAFTLCRLRS